MNEPTLKKILHVTFNMEIGGTEQVICQIVENSNTEKFAHEILCIDGRVGSLGCDLKTKGFHVISTKRKQGLDVRLIRYVHNLILERDIELLHCHQYTPYFYGILGALGTKAKLIFTEHGRFFPDRHNFKRRIINPLLILRTNYITTISESTAEAVSKYEYINPKKIQVIYNGTKDLSCDFYDSRVLLHELELSPNFRYLGTVSRLEPIKNQSMMIKAFAEVIRRVPDLRLIIIGDGAIRSELESLVKTLHLEKEIIFTGFIDNPQRYMNLFEIFLLSSFSEGTSMTLLEAMSLSKPCVVTDVGGNPEIVVNDKTGFVEPSNDADKFALAVLRLLEDGKVRKKFGAEGRNRFLTYFSVGQMVKKYENLYLEEISNCLP